MLLDLTISSPLAALASGAGLVVRIRNIHEEADEKG